MMRPLGVGQSIRRALLLATGQVTQYGGMADDGFYQKGVSRSYTVLTTGQYAGTTALTLNGKTDNHSNACVFDNSTKLMWSRTHIGNIGPVSLGTLPWTMNGSGEGIFQLAAVANAANLSGYSDWRIPNVVEMASLQRHSAASGYPDTVAFPVWPAGSTFYTSTTTPTNVLNAQYAVFPNGSMGGIVKTTNMYSILVRGG